MPQNVGDKAAEGMAEVIGSWKFLIIQTVIVLLWLLLNTAGWFVWHWDAPPFILLNLVFSTQAAYATPVLLMAANASAKRDRAMAEMDDQEIGELLALQRLQIDHDKWVRETLTKALEK